ncbi:MAG: galactarate dehydratase [Gammaproteobacteria bacterium]|nr:MAG: galactarate dehydratase [Gammaproteobacteria bacterium]
MTAKTVRLHPHDPIAVAKQTLPAGTPLPEYGGLRTVDDIPALHKVAIRDITAGSPIRKYDQLIGVATTDIPAGAHVHTHNCAATAATADYEPCADRRPVEPLPPERRARFLGYPRPDGRVGTRNYIGVLATVNCAATVVRRIAAAAQATLDGGHWPGIDGVVAFVHPYGCGMSGNDESFELLRRTLAGYCAHPNLAAVLVVGLGCEVMQIERLLGESGLADERRHRHLVIQDSGGTPGAIEQGRRIVEDWFDGVNALERRPVGAEHLILGLQCGGSDALSGVTANPALGRAVDLLVQHGGTAVLSETPEIYGAEHLLIRRAAEPAVAEKLIARLHWWEDYVAKFGGTLDNNPSPGNKQGGLTTILEKSLGAQAKAGTTPLNAVYEYAETIRAKGLVFMDSPGYDPVSATGQIAGGANLIAFTTGRGSAFGSKPVPTLKLASNSELYRRMPDDMDINCGCIFDGECTLEDCGQRIFEALLRVASGERTASERLGYGDEEFNPWRIGAVY